MITVNNLSDFKGAEKYGTCNECQKGSKEVELYRIKVNDSCLCLCEKHLRTLKSKLFYVTK